MSDIRVGDKVRLVTPFEHLAVGDIGTVVEINQQRPLGPYHLVRFDQSEKPTNGWADGWYVPFNSVELVVPKVNVGDKVRVYRKVDYYRYGASQGAEGIVTTTDASPYYGRQIDVYITKSANGDDVVGERRYYRREDLEVTEAATPLRVGQAVRVVWSYVPEAYDGRTGIVTAIYSINSIGVEFNDGDQLLPKGASFYRSQLEPVTEQATPPAFKIGDRVKVVGHGDRYIPCACIGSVGRITETNTVGGDRRHHVEFDTLSVPHIDAGVYSANEIELVVDESKPTPTFKIGDKVRLMTDRWSPSVKKGAIGVVTGDSTIVDSDGSTLLVRFDGSRCPTNGFRDGWWIQEHEMERIDEEESTTQPTETRTWQVGDRVRLKQDAVDWLKSMGGAIRYEVSTQTTGVVAWLYDEYEEVRVRLDGVSEPRGFFADGWALKNEWIELIPPSKFNVGDRVRIVADPARVVASPVGAVGTVIRVDRCYATFPIQVRLDSFMAAWYNEVELEHAIDWTTPTDVKNVSVSEVDALARALDEDRIEHVGDALVRRCGDRLYRYKLEAVADAS